MTAQEIKQTYAAENGIIYIFENTRFTFPVMLTIVIGAGMVFFPYQLHVHDEIPKKNKLQWKHLNH